MIIDSVKHPIIEKLRHFKGSNFQEFILDSLENIQRLLDSNNPQYNINTILSLESLDQFKSYKSIKKYLVKKTIFSHVFGHNKVNVVAIVEFNNRPLDHVNKLIILDNILDYGNIGAIIRNGYMMGINNFLIINNVHCFYNKILESSRGLIFNSNIQLINNHEEALDICKNNNLTPIIMGFNGKNIKDIPPLEKFALVFGNETCGHNSLWESINHYELTIPMIYNEFCDSINVACASAIVINYYQNLY